MNKVRNIYFVRHGQTDANLADGLGQHVNSKLNEQGKNQASKLGKRLSNNIFFDTLVTSELSRAVETGEIVMKECGQVTHIKISDLNERKKPSKMVGIPKKSNEYQGYLSQFKEHAGDPNWRPEDGENLNDILKRIDGAIGYIETHTTGDVLVVCHGFLLRLIVTRLLTSSEDSGVYVHAIDNIRFENTGITHVKLFEDGHWQFGTINDSTHLP